MAGAAIASELVARAAAGDERAFTDLIAPLAPAGLRLALAILQDRPAAEDVLQDSILRAWQRTGQLRDPAGVRPWFLAIVRNRCRDLLRAPWHRLSLTIKADSPVPSPADFASRSLDVGHALARLSRSDRALIFMRFHEDMSMAEVARAAGISVGAARVRVHRALGRMRPDLEIPEELL